MTSHQLLWIPRIIGILALSASANAQFRAAPGSPFAVGLTPVFVAEGDFNGDGIPDLAIANQNDNTVTVLLGNGTGGFTAAPGSPIRVGYVPQSVAIADVNGDGNADLVVANADNNDVTVLLGNGTGGFTAATGSPFPTGGLWPSAVAVGDFNGDGHLDLAIANTNSNNLTVLLGNGAGGFTAATGSPFPLGTKPVSVAVGDFNGDTKLDLAIANNNSNNITVLLGNGTGGFTAAPGSPVVVGAHPNSVAAADLNGDGKLDLAVANFGSNNVTVLLGSGTGGFTAAPGSPWPVGTNPSSVAVGDFNQDGKPDLAIANAGSNNVTLLLGNGTGGFTALQGSPFTVGTDPVALTVGDFNQDGKPDLAVVSSGTGTVSVLLYRAAGGNILWQNNSTTQVVAHYFGGPLGITYLGYAWVDQTGAHGWKVVGTGDFDGNGVPDLVWMNTTTRQVVVHYYGGPGGTTYLGWNWLQGADVPGWTVVAVADMNGDGVPDLIWQNDTTNQVVVDYYGGAEGAVFQSWNSLDNGEPSGWQVVGAADFDGNGTPDLVWQYTPTGQVVVHYYGGAGGATYQGWNWLQSEDVPGWTVVGAVNFDGSGVPDLVWENESTTQVVVHYYGGTGGATYLGWNWLEQTGAPGWSAMVPY